jgi:hypothetical protein
MSLDETTNLLFGMNQRRSIGAITKRLTTIRPLCRLRPEAGPAMVRTGRLYDDRHLPNGASIGHVQRVHHPETADAIGVDTCYADGVSFVLPNNSRDVIYADDAVSRAVDISELWLRRGHLFRNKAAGGLSPTRVCCLKSANLRGIAVRQILRGSGESS